MATNQTRVGIGFAIAALFALVASCSTETVSRVGLSDPMAANLERAVAIAHAELDKPWILHTASSRYDLTDGSLLLDDNAYVFVSDDGAASYWLVRFEADGTISNGPVAGGLLSGPRAFDFGANGLTSYEAVEIALDEIGEALVDRCGPIDWIDVVATRSEEGHQWWRVDHSTVGEVHTVWINAGTGELGEIEQENC